MPRVAELLRRVWKIAADSRLAAKGRLVFGNVAPRYAFNTRSVVS